MRTERKFRDQERAGTKLQRSRRSVLMARHSVLAFTFCAMFFALCSFASAQQQGKVVRVGEIVFRSRPDFGPGRTAFRQQLRELGYVEGKNVAFESRSAEGRLERYRILADELVRLRVTYFLRRRRMKL